jgi:hypothetical protein
MVHDLKTKLLSGVITSTKPERVRYELPSGKAFSVGGILSITVATFAAIGLLMFVIDRMKFLF